MTEGPFAGATGPLPAAGWYDDPWAGGWQRYWDGTRWTADAFPAGPGAAAPPVGAPTVRAAVPPPAPTWNPLRSAPSAPAAPRREVLEPAPPTGGGPSGRTFLVALGLLAAVVLAVLGLVALARSLGDTGTVASASASPTPTPSPTPSPSFAPPTPSDAPTPVPPSQPTGPSDSPSPVPSGPGGSVSPAPTDGLPSAPPSPPVDPFPPQQSAPADPDADALQRIVVTQQDVGTDMVVGVIDQGATLDAPTLDLCNASYPSEAQRTARLQTAEVDGAGQGRLSTEAVLYGSSADTAEAFAELAKVARTCPSTPVTGSDGTAQTTTFLPAPDRTWPAPPQSVQRLAYRVTITDSGGSRDLVAVYLRRGRVLVGLYFPSPNGAQPPVAGATSVPGIVSVFEKRLADLPTSVTGGA